MAREERVQLTLGKHDRSATRHALARSQAGDLADLIDLSLRPHAVPWCGCRQLKFWLPQGLNPDPAKLRDPPKDQDHCEASQTSDSHPAKLPYRPKIPFQLKTYSGTGGWVTCKLNTNQLYR